jgi:hypothetical protein
MHPPKVRFSDHPVEWVLVVEARQVADFPPG